MSMHMNSTNSTRKYSSTQNLTTDGSSGNSSRSFSAFNARIPQPPLNEFQPPKSTLNVHEEIQRNLSDRKKETVFEVRELRQQVNMLNYELRQLRNDYSGSIQHLNSIDENTVLASGLRNSKQCSPAISLDNHRMDMNDKTRPPLPPRLYRPAKPLRTFAHGSTTILNIPTDHSAFISPSMPTSTCTSANSSFRSDRPAVIPSRDQSIPPPPPPRLAVNRGSGFYQQGPPPPPKPRALSAAVISSDQNGFGNFHMQRYASRQASGPTNIANRPPQIQTNGSINGSNNGSPPRYQHRSPLPAYHAPNRHPMLAYSQSALDISNAKSTDKHTKVNDHRKITDPRFSDSHSKIDMENGHDHRKMPADQSKITDHRQENQRKLNLDNLENLIQFGGDPLTDENLVQTLAKGFQKGVCWYELGSVLLFLNPFNDIASPPTLDNSKDAPHPLKKLATDIRSRFFESDHSQAVIFAGDKGSGKSYLSSQLIQQLFRVFNGDFNVLRSTADYEPYRQFSATMNLLRSLTSVRRHKHNYSSHAAFLYELHIADGIIQKAKTFSCFLDYHRLANLPQGECNFQIFYLLMAGLSLDEKRKFHLIDQTIDTLNYLKSDISADIQFGLDKILFAQFKSSLSILGIPFSDIIRIFAAVLLLGNVRFMDGQAGDLIIDGKKELDSAAALLGVTTLSLFKALTRHHRNQKGDSVQIPATSQSANCAISSLSMTLYHRCTSAIIRRANTLKNGRMVNGMTTARNSHGSNARPASGISSSDESSVHDSGIGLTTNQASPNCNHEINISSSRDSCQVLDGVISIVDWFGFANFKHNQFEHLCSNYASEKLQQFYQNTMFKRVEQLAISEGVQMDFEWQDSNDRSWPCSAMTSLFQMLNDCTFKNQDEFSEVIQERIGGNRSVKIDQSSNKFTCLISHYGGSDLIYEDIHGYLNINRDELSSELIRIFSSQTCNFGFISYLFAPDLRIIERPSERQEMSRITPISAVDSRQGKTTFSQDFALQLDAFLRSISGSKIQFVNCIKPNSKTEYFYFDPVEVGKQCKRLDILQSIHLLNAGLPYAIKLKEFNDRYRFLALRYHNASILKQAPNSAEEARAIIDCYLRAVDESNLPYISNHWSLGNEHIFLSEGAQNQLDLLRDQYRSKSAITIQSHVRKWLRKKAGLPLMNGKSMNGTGHPTRIPNSMSHTIKSAPPLPPTRGYSVYLDKKICFPQRRVFIQNYTDSHTSRQFRQDEIATAIGWATTKNQLLIRDRGFVNGQMTSIMVAVPIDCTKICLDS